jgi:hypothetical protein
MRASWTALFQSPRPQQAFGLREVPSVTHLNTANNAVQRVLRMWDKRQSSVVFRLSFRVSFGQIEGIELQILSGREHSPQNAGRIRRQASQPDVCGSRFAESVVLEPMLEQFES